MVERRGYPSDLTVERWALIEPVITAWKAAHPSVSGHQGRYEMREIVNAIFYQSRTGCQWEYLPHDLPPPGAVKYYFYKWRDDGTTETIHEILRCQVRERAGRAEDPSLVVLDSQSVHAAVNVPASTTGRDAAKKVPGRKKGIAVDVLGLIIAVVVMAASVHENQVGTALLDKVAARTPAVTKALVDQGFKNTVVAHGAKSGIDVEIVERNPQDKGFIPQLTVTWNLATEKIIALSSDHGLRRLVEHHGGVGAEVADTRSA
ncbi:IS5 family transposase [Actinospica durhamensis]|uniref:IS5 family transposase n=1 Tax=Actinospica durhamensis TaxID=1508375 RepID=A0A941EY61_9ACTN|nr:IS5 family transposase [Actinospica durhamensis]MBR7838608.1 IS5 family transposase [Actinospica durhamensis]